MNMTLPQTLTLLLLFQVASANVIGFDLGHSFFKITLVRPGRPFDIVENTMGGRKTESVVTITEENRLFGKDAIMASTRFTSTTFGDALSFVGESEAAPRFLFPKMAEDDRG